MKQLLRLSFILPPLMNGANLYAQKPARLQGQARIDSLLGELPKQKDDTNKVKLLSGLSFGYYAISPDEGIKYGQQEIDLATKLGWQKGIALAYNDVGVNYFFKSDNQKALEYYLKALKLYDDIGNKKGAANVSSNIGGIYANQGNNPKALEYFFKTLKHYEETGNKAGTANVSGNIGSIYGEQNDFPKALEYFFKALKVYEEFDNKAGIANSNANIGAIYYKQVNYPKTLEYYLKALKLDEEIGSKNSIAVVTGDIGGLYVEQQNYVMAAKYIQRSLKLCDELGNKQLMAVNLSHIAGIYIHMVMDTAAKAGKIKSATPFPSDNFQGAVFIPHGKAALLAGAIDYERRALAISKEIQNPDLMLGSYSQLSAAYKLNGDYRKALETSDNYYAIKDSLFSAENNKKIIQQGMKYEFEKKEAVAKVEQDKKDALGLKELQKQKLVRNGFMGGFAVVLLFAGIFFNQRNKIKLGKKQSDELLLNILPTEVAEELKTKGNAEAKLIDQVAVLFTDFKGFTQLSEKLSPKALVAEINDCFSAFDHIMHKYGVEKIKTIGDSYMAAGGLPTTNKTHPEDVVNAALEIQQYMSDHKTKKEAAGELYFEIRIGVHSGPVVAGIVGVKKFQYDIWGDTVNTASRMESSGAVGKVNISGATHVLVKDKFACEYRGEIDAKGKGQLKMYFVSRT